MSVEYRVADWLSVASEYESEAAVVHLDANWAAPERNGACGVDYPTHPIRPEDESDFSDAELERDHIDTSHSISEFIDAAWTALEDGGWLILDADSYAAPRMIDYLRSEYGEVRSDDHAGRPYRGGGLRKTGGVTYVKADGTPDSAGNGRYGSEGGYPVLFAHKDETDREWSASVRQIARRPRWTEPTDEYQQGTVKPVSPYRTWLSEIADAGDLVLVPCAGSAPAAIAAEQEWDADANVVCIDPSDSSHDAYQRRREALIDDKQTSLIAATQGGETA